MEQIELLKSGAKELGIELSVRQLQEFSLFYDMLIEKNKVMNLTAITEPRDVVIKHFLDSLSLVKAIKPEQGMKILDLGTGAGFPGIPLRIAFPETNYVLADSLNKRLNFINEYIEKYRFDNIVTVHGRAEDLSRQKEYRESFDLCVSRAVANLSTLSEYCLPFVKTNGMFAAYKSEDIEEEVKNAGSALKILGGKLEKVTHFTLGPDKLQRTIVLIKKVRETPVKYPRKAGTPSKEPL